MFQQMKLTISSAMEIASKFYADFIASLQLVLTIAETASSLVVNNEILINDYISKISSVVSGILERRLLSLVLIDHFELIS